MKESLAEQLVALAWQATETDFVNAAEDMGVAREASLVIWKWVG